MATLENETTSTPAVIPSRTPPSLVDLSRRSTRSFFASYLESNLVASPGQGPRMISVHVNFLTKKITVTENVDDMMEEEEEGGEEISEERRESVHAAVEAMETVEVAEKGVECAICLKEFKVEGEIEVAKKLPCEHKYHFGCIERWLGIHGSCPTCRYEMSIGEGGGDEGGEGGGIEEDVIEHGGNSFENGVVFDFVVDGSTGLVYSQLQILILVQSRTGLMFDVEMDMVFHYLNECLFFGSSRVNLGFKTLYLFGL